MLPAAVARGNTSFDVVADRQASPFCSERNGSTGCAPAWLADAMGDHTSIEPLLREAIGRRLRALRLARGERLIETAARAGVSPQYLSEVERGLKEPSSEMIAAISGALHTSLVDLTAGVASDLGFVGTGAQEQRIRSAETDTAGRVAAPAPAPAAAPSAPAPTFELYAVAA